MTFRDSPWPDGTPCWADLMVPDPRMAMDFYGALFGWTFADQGDEAGNYLMCTIDGRAVAGIGGIPPDQAGMPAAWTTYLATSDIDKSVDAVGAAGGQIMMPPMDVLAAGKMAITADPTGAAFGLWQAGEHFGAALANVPGAMAWNECMTRDFDTAKAFYGDAFGYEFDDMSAGGFSYATIKINGEVVGGVGGLPGEVPAEVPAHWSTYFGVVDTDAAVAKVTQLGGDVLRAPADSPYGRVAQVTDNQGAALMLVSIDEATGG
ncbi:VOC family protein [Qaidamihabitans albus]|uniref:VOC family protein n=1 Tax=Qaidamihabitans albus TaxID=2795733 RepID=UPI0018F20F54|nr:VOC family protein [Qaidamihabitans albus]